LPKDVDEMYIDVGIYGVSPKTGKFDPEKKIRDLEKFVTKLKGYVISDEDISWKN